MTRPPGSPPNPERPDSDGAPDDFDTAIVQAQEAAAGLLAQARQDDLEYTRLCDVLAGACLDALNAGRGLDADRQAFPAPRSWAKVDPGSITLGLSGWVGVTALIQDDGPRVRCQIPTSAVVAPHPGDHAERLLAFFEGREQPLPLPAAIPASDFTRFTELHAQQESWQRLFVSCANGADHAGRVQLLTPEPGGTYWTETFASYARSGRTPGVINLHDDTATLTIGDQALGTIDWVTLLLFDPDSRLYRRYLSLHDANPRPLHLAARAAATQAAREAHERNDHARKLLDKIRCGAYGPMPEGVTYTDDLQAGPAVVFPPQDRTRRSLHPQRILLDPAIDPVHWVAEFNDGTRQSLNVRVAPGYASSLAAVIQSARADSTGTRLRAF